MYKSFHSYGIQLYNSDFLADRDVFAQVLRSTSLSSLDSRLHNFFKKIPGQSVEEINFMLGDTMMSLSEQDFLEHVTTWNRLNTLIRAYCITVSLLCICILSNA